MTTLTSPRGRAGALLGLLAAAVLIAGCGSSSSSSRSTSAASTSAPAGASSANGLRISTAKGSVGTYLVGAGGRALYMWAGDSRGRSNCSGSCAKVWPPVPAAATPSVSGGVMASTLGTITRADGGRQLTYGGHPLYYFQGDSGAGTDNGQGHNAFGAKWWLLAPAGAAITASGSASANGAGSSSSSHYGY
ncbi:MAG TPA: hypothetical protein VF781_01890 [Solirubrobacteraceae bacterium]